MLVAVPTSERARSIEKALGRPADIRSGISVRGFRASQACLRTGFAALRAIGCGVVGSLPVQRDARRGCDDITVIAL